MKNFTTIFLALLFLWYLSSSISVEQVDKKYFDTKISNIFILQAKDKTDTLYLESTNYNMLRFSHKSFNYPVIIPMDSVIAKIDDDAFTVKVHRKEKTLKLK